MTETDTPVEVLIVAHGQPSNPDPAEEALAKFTAGIQAAIPGHVIRSATLAAPGCLEKALSQMEDGGVVYPLFMADGWFVRTALINRISDAALNVVISIMPPFGMDTTLPGVTAQCVKEAMKNGESEQLFVAAHGSAFGTAPAASAQLFVERLQKELPELDIRLGFLEQDPSIEVMAKGLMPGTPCLPFFAMPGEHALQDVPDALAIAGFDGVVMPVISLLDGADLVVTRALSQALAKRAAN